MTENHPITPPPELVEEWRNLPEYVSQLRAMSTVTITTEKLQHIATQAARWGADQELEACCKVLHQHDRAYLLPSQLREYRRPKPPSLKELALGALGRFNANAHTRADEMIQDFDTIRLALEALPE